ncbi:MAG: response regulator, partial [Burkholderiaceae bacterium]
VLMDRRMPGMDGLQATRLIRALPEAHHTRVIMVTASAFEEDRQLAMESGVDGFVSKPFREAEMLQELQRVFPSIVYHSENKENAGILATAHNGDWKNDMTTMDATLADELIDLIECGNVVRFEQLIVERLSDSAPLLCRHLQTLAEQFDYKNIVSVLQVAV